MNLFFKSLFGRLMSTEKFESSQKQLVEDYKRYLEVEASEDLAEYKELSAKVKSSDFKELKRTLVNRKYKDTQEYRDMAKYTKLDKKESLKLYFEVLESQELADYLAFKDTPEYVNLSDKKAVKESEELQKFKNFEKSKEFKAYNRFHDSYIEKEYLELKEKVNTPEFIQNNQFWSNPRRWESTEEYQLECRYHFLDSDANIRFYCEHTKEEFKNAEEYKLHISDEFDWKSLDKSQWETGFYYTTSALVANHSFANEKQSNNKGKNIRVEEGRLHIDTKEEQNQSLAWNREKGLVMTEFDYTSDVIHAKDICVGKYGVFSAKMRFNGSKQVSHAFFLKGGFMLPHVNICKRDKRGIEVGVYGGTLDNVERETALIKGINTHKDFVYTLVWNDQELIWYINNLEVFRTTKLVPHVDLCPMLNSFIQSNRKGGEADFDIDYIKIYTKK